MTPADRALMRIAALDVKADTGLTAKEIETVRAYAHSAPGVLTGARPAARRLLARLGLRVEK